MLEAIKISRFDANVLLTVGQNHGQAGCNYQIQCECFFIAGQHHGWAEYNC